MNGLVTAGFHRQFGYDDLHRLTTTSTGSQLWGTRPYTYDAMTWTSETPKPPTGTTTKRYHFYTPDLRFLSRADYSVSTSGAATLIRRIEPVWFAGIPVAQIDHNDLAFLRYTFTDHLGAPILQTSATGAIVWQVDREPYGRVWRIRNGTLAAQPLQLPGQEVATERELYNVFRWYRSGWGRYTQADPIGLVGREYPYVSNNPILHTDMLGLRDTGVALRRPVFRDVCTRGARGIAGAAGRALGLITMILAASDANPVEFEEGRGEGVVCDDEPRKCRPCIPPVGTIAYREDTNPRSRPHRGVPPPHWKLYKMSQNPINCQCFWDDIPDNRGGFGPSPPPPGTVSIAPAAGGGFW